MVDQLLRAQPFGEAVENDGDRDTSVADARIAPADCSVCGDAVPYAFGGHGSPYLSILKVQHRPESHRLDYHRLRCVADCGASRRWPIDNLKLRCITNGRLSASWGVARLEPAIRRGIWNARTGTPGRLESAQRHEERAHRLRACATYGTNPERTHGQESADRGYPGTEQTGTERTETGYRRASSNALGSSSIR